MTLPNCKEVFLKLRKERGLSRNKLAREAKVEYRAIAELEKGNNCRVETIMKLAAPMNMTPGELLDALLGERGWGDER